MLVFSGLFDLKLISGEAYFLVVRSAVLYRIDRTTRSSDIVIWNFRDAKFHDVITNVVKFWFAIRPYGPLRHSTQENIVLKYRLIPTRAVGEEAFWKCGQTDRQTPIDDDDDDDNELTWRGIKS